MDRLLVQADADASQARSIGEWLTDSVTVQDVLPGIQAEIGPIHQGTSW